MNKLVNLSEDLRNRRAPALKISLEAQLKRNFWLLIIVVLPTIAATIYYGLVASNQFVSTSRFIVKSPGERTTQMSTLANLIQTTGLSSGQEETNAILDYVRSRNALKDAEKTFDVKAAFSRPQIDYLSRFPGLFEDNTFENLFDFYRSKVDAHLDRESGIAVITVKAFTPVDAQALNTRLLSLSEALVNKLNKRAESHAIAEASQRLAEAEQRVTKAREALEQYRNSEDLIDPGKQAGGIFEIITSLTERLAVLQAQYQTMQRTAPENPALPNLKRQISALDAQIRDQTDRVVGQKTAIASKIGTYEKLLQEQKFATDMVSLASTSLEAARAEANKQQFYLERVVEPEQPDMATYPRRVKSILTVFGALLGLYFIGWMLIVGILEHSPED